MRAGMEIGHTGVFPTYAIVDFVEADCIGFGDWVAARIGDDEGEVLGMSVIEQEMRTEGESEFGQADVIIWCKRWAYLYDSQAITS